MNIERLTDYWIKYKEYFELPEPENDEKYKWTVLAQVFEKWDWKAPNKLEMFKNAFEVKGNKNLWLSGQYFPITHTIWMFEVFPKETIEAFDYLFNETIPILERINKFIGLYDEKLPYLKEIAPDRKVNYHSHGCMRATALYLFLQNPNKYYLFKYTMVKDFCLNLDEPTIKKGNHENLDLFFKHADNVLNFIKSDTEFISRYNLFIQENNRYQDKSLHLLTQDFIYYISKSNKSNSIKYWRIGTDDNDENEYWELMKEENKVCIGWSGIGDLDILNPKNKNDIIQAFTNTGAYKQDNMQTVKSRKAGEVFNFYNSISVVDIVLAQNGQNVNAIGKVTDDYYYNDEDEFAHQRPVEWLVLNPNFKNKEGLRTTVCEIKDKSTIDIINLKLQKKVPLMSDKYNLYNDYYKFLDKFELASFTKENYRDIAIKYINKAWNEKYSMDYDPEMNDSNTLTEILSICNKGFDGGFNGKDRFINFLKNLLNLEHPLNLILYGSPGTGKTYLTKKLAAEIITGQSFHIDERDKTLEIYSELERLGYVNFITFHQSMSYEDFIEGIKPDNDNENESIRYKTTNGIFKDICINASLKSSTNFDSSYSNLLTKLEAEDILKVNTPTGSVFGISKNKNNNLTLYTGKELKHNGTLTKENIIKHLLGAKKFEGWEGYFTGVIELLKTEFGYNGNFYVHQSKHVLIIDEINRGNVSSIFGELITLLEEDKRKGNSEEISAILPYSQSKFTVPNNLYIIGTMNTADRSVEALDTALRRRFVFKEIQVDYELLSEISINTQVIDLSKILKTINHRLEILINRDHQIGHSYFLKIESFPRLKNVFKNNIIPLLEEYFFGDIGKICLVLGDNFMELVYSNTNDLKNALAKSKVYKEIDFVLDKQVYKVKDIDSLEAKDFISIYQDTNIEEE
ncbi:MAG: AAA family ATPase [Chitinophagales bacterium]